MVRTVGMVRDIYRELTHIHLKKNRYIIIKKIQTKNHKKVQIHSIDTDGGDLFVRTDT